MCNKTVTIYDCDQEVNNGLRINDKYLMRFL